MKIKRIISAITSVSLAISALSFYATAWTKPEYGFDYDAVMAPYCDSCYYEPYCSDEVYAENSYEYGSIFIFLKCEYSYFNSVWTAEDFPEAKAAGITIEEVKNSDIRYADYTDEEIIEHLQVDEYARHTRIRIFYEDASEINEAKLGGAIIDACKRGEHPEIGAVCFDMDLYKPSLVQDCDFNGDHIIDSIDVTMIIRHCVGVYQLDCAYLEFADINGDDSIDALDATLLTRFAVGAIDGFEIHYPF